MRAVYLHIIDALIAALVLISCTTTIEIVAPESAAVVEMSIVAEVADDTRTAIDEAHGKVVWSKGDVLKIIETTPHGTTFKDTNAIAIDNNGKATFGVSFEASAAAEFAYDAIYPASAVLTNGSTDNTLVALNDMQRPSATSFDPDADILVAQRIVTDTQPTELRMRFKRLVAMGKIIIKGLPESCAISEVVFAAEGHALAGQNVVNTAEGTVVEYGHTALDPITMCYDAPIVSRDIYFTCNPFTLFAGEAFSITVTCSNGDAYTKCVTIPSGATFALSEGDLNIFSVNLEGCKEESSSLFDTLTRETTGIADGGGYKAWSYTSACGIAYAGQSAGDHNSIQLRAGHESGIVITSSNYRITKIAVKWDTNTSKGRTINVYGKSEPYTSTTDLYDDSMRGTHLGTIVKDTSSEIVIDGDYSYIGLNVKSDVVYLSAIEVYYTSGEPGFYVSPTECNFSAAGGVATIDVVPINGFDATVTATTEAEWLTITNFGYRYDICAAENSGEARQTTITFTAPEGECITLPVTQASGNNAGWTLVTSAEELNVGDKIIIAAKEYDYVLSTVQNKNNRARATITKSDNSITFGEDAQIITLEAGAATNSYALNVGDGYLIAASSTNNYLHTEATMTANSSWGIEIASNGTATIKACGENTRNQLQYYQNNATGCFSCYANKQKDVVIYKLFE